MMQSLRETQTQVLVIAIGKDKWEMAIEIANELWSARVATEFVSCAPSKILNQFKRADGDQIPWVVTVGDAELERGVVKLKNMQAKKEEEVERATLVQGVLARIAEAAN